MGRWAKRRYDPFYRCNDILYRLPDIYLLCAEAYAHTGNVQGAIGYINVIRRRAGMRDYTTGEGELLMAVFEERERELFWKDTAIMI